MADNEYTNWVIFPSTQLRVEIDTCEGDVSRFVVQLEYDKEWDYDTTSTSDWAVVARFDHDPDTEFGHDITHEGLHLDIYRDGEKARVERGFPKVPLNQAPGWCEGYLSAHASRYVRRFKRWHNVSGPEDNG
jgi:hypothetical protein